MIKVILMDSLPINITLIIAFQVRTCLDKSGHISNIDLDCTGPLRYF